MMNTAGASNSLVQKFLRKVPQYTRNARHFRSLMQHGGPRKWTNLVLAEAERKLKRTTTRSRPYLLIIDPCNFCNLRCPLCPTGFNDLGRPQAMLSFEHFRHYFDPFAPYLFEVYLHNWGESLLNKEVYRMIEHAQRSNVGTNLSSNFVEVSSSDLDRILDSGLEYLVISLDGTTQEVYSKYRVRGNLDKVVTNLSELLRRRRARGLRYPVVEWQYIVMKHNEHQIPEAERLAKQLGVDLLRFIPVGLPYESEDRKALAEEWFPVTVTGRVETNQEEQQFGQAGKPGPCFYLYRSMVINSDGGVSPCCIVYKQQRDFAALSPQQPVNVLEVWNNEMYRSARALFAGSHDQPRPSTVCHGCDIFRRD
jgi:MoaA/NifB/PqqE/SkfB family radical SAM enzyme